MTLECNLAYVIEELERHPMPRSEIGQALRDAQAAVHRIAAAVTKLMDGDAAGTDVESSACSEQRPRRARLLLIDDDEQVLRATARALREHDVVALSDASVALARLLQGETFDVILCDVAMPGLDGFGFHDAAALHVPDMARRIVFITGGATTAGALRGLRETENLVLQKPVEVTALRRLIFDRLA